MIVIETCPVCGGDLLRTYLTMYPPTVNMYCPSCGWSSVGKPEEVVRIPYGGNNAPSKSVHIRHFGGACEHCSNNPKNGGSGICHCTLGLEPIIC